MELLLVAATRQEIALFTEENPAIDYLVTGVGIPATMYYLQKKLVEKKYDFVIQAGIAGSYNELLKPGQLTIVKQDCFADLGMETCEEFTTLFDAGFTDRNEFPYTNGWLVNPTPGFDLLNYPVVKGSTVNKVTDSTLQKKQVQELFSPDIESMEGAAFHYVCLQEQIPFLQLRSISNAVGVRDKAQWHIKTAIEHLNTSLRGIVNQLSNLQGSGHFLSDASKPIAQP
jgi:futalosine hydrolase